MMLRQVLVITFVVLAAGNSLANAEPDAEAEKIASVADDGVDPSKVVSKKQTVEELADEELAKLDRDYEAMLEIYHKAKFSGHVLEKVAKERKLIKNLLEAAFQQRATIIKEAVESARALESESDFIEAVYKSHLEGNKEADSHLNEINGIVDTTSPIVLHKCRHEIMQKRIEAYQDKLVASSSSLSDDGLAKTVSANQVVLPEIKRLADEEIAKLGQDYEEMAGTFSAVAYDPEYILFYSIADKRDLILSKLIKAFKKRAEIIESALDEANKMKSSDEFYKTMYGAHLEAYEKSQETFDSIFQIDDEAAPYTSAKECRDKIMAKRMNAYKEKLDSSSVAEIEEAKKKWVPSEFSRVMRMKNEELSALRHDSWVMKKDITIPYEERPENPDESQQFPYAAEIKQAQIKYDFNKARELREKVINDALVGYYRTVREFYQAMVKAHQDGNRLAERQYDRFYMSYDSKTSYRIDRCKRLIEERLREYKSKLTSLPKQPPTVIPASHVPTEKPAKRNVIDKLAELFKPNRGAPSKKKSTRV